MHSPMNGDALIGDEEIVVGCINHFFHGQFMKASFFHKRCRRKSKRRAGLPTISRRAELSFSSHEPSSLYIFSIRQSPPVYSVYARRIATASAPPSVSFPILQFRCRDGSLKSSISLLPRRWFGVALAICALDFGPHHRPNRKSPYHRSNRQRKDEAIRCRRWTKISDTLTIYPIIYLVNGRFLLYV